MAPVVHEQDLVYDVWSDAPYVAATVRAAL